MTLSFDVFCLADAPTKFTAALRASPHSYLDANYCYVIIRLFYDGVLLGTLHIALKQNHLLNNQEEDIGAHP